MKVLRICLVFVLFAAILAAAVVMHYKLRPLIGPRQTSWTIRFYDEHGAYSRSQPVKSAGPPLVRILDFDGNVTGYSEVINGNQATFWTSGSEMDLVAPDGSTVTVEEH